MDDLEQKLKQALAREDAPPWFEARVLAAAKAQSVPKVSWWQRSLTLQKVHWATAAAAVLFITTGVWQHERAVEQRQAGEAAKEKVKIALRIASAKLQRIQAKVDGIGEGGERTQ